MATNFPRPASFGTQPTRGVSRQIRHLRRLVRLSLERNRYSDALREIQRVGDTLSGRIADRALDFDHHHPAALRRRIRWRAFWARHPFWRGVAQTAVICGLFLGLGFAYRIALVWWVGAL